jgi:UDP-glucuronate 4-epimerase
MKTPVTSAGAHAAWEVLATYANVEDLRQTVGFEPNTRLKEGVGKFVAWFKTY